MGLDGGRSLGVQLAARRKRGGRPREAAADNRDKGTSLGQPFWDRRTERRWRRHERWRAVTSRSQDENGPAHDRFPPGRLPTAVWFDPTARFR